MTMPRYLFITFAPVAAAENIRRVLAESGAGKLGNYDSCSFSSRGTGRFRPLKGAKPAIGEIGNIEEVEEERIEVMVECDGVAELKRIIAALRKAHPYEEPAIHISPLLDI